MHSCHRQGHEDTGRPVRGVAGEDLQVHEGLVGACCTAVCGCLQVDQIVALRGEILQVNEGLRLSEAGKLEAEAQVQALKDQIAARKADGER